MPAPNQRFTPEFREEAFGGQALVDFGRARHIRLHRGARSHVRDHVHYIRVAGFGDVDLPRGSGELFP